MKKYRVEYKWDDEQQFAGFTPHCDFYDTVDGFFEAETEKEAILSAIELIVENIDYNTIIGEDEDGDCYIFVYDDENNVIFHYYAFKATEKLEQ